MCVSAQSPVLCVAFMKRTLQPTALEVKKNLYKTCKKAASPSLRTVRKSRTVELVRTAYRLGTEIACNRSKVRLACCFLSRVSARTSSETLGYAGRFAFVGSHTGHQSPGMSVPIPGPCTFLAGRTPLPSQSSASVSCHLRMALICDLRFPLVCGPQHSAISPYAELIRWPQHAQQPGHGRRRSPSKGQSSRISGQE